MSTHNWATLVKHQFRYRSWSNSSPSICSNVCPFVRLHQFPSWCRLPTNNMVVHLGGELHNQSVSQWVSHSNRHSGSCHKLSLFNTNSANQHVYANIKVKPRHGREHWSANNTRWPQLCYHWFAFSDKVFESSINRLATNVATCGPHICVLSLNVPFCSVISFHSIWIIIYNIFLDNQIHNLGFLSMFIY